ncbi:PREDICTED: separase isoform X3 [Theobroma cacao]|uniref:separase n=1 Tax=Theobroma cacao TaxID=3641 RepID=A0AB32VVA1_THECC|nr:PREDICTED: separase isoform X3 [Theobroma cacao]
MPPPTESSLLSDLQTSDDSQRLHSIVSDYLRPVSTLANSKKTSKKADQTTVRSLAKQFLSFLSKSFPIIYNRLYIQNPSQQQRDILSPFYDTYRQCLTCLDFISSQLAGGPHMVQIQRLKLVYCLQAWGRYEEGESESFRVLERLRGEADSEGKFVPSIDVGGGDSKFGSVVVEAVASVVKNVAMGQSKDCGKYERVLALLEEVRPWCSLFRELESVAIEKSHNVLVTFLGRCCRFLVEEMNHFGEDLIRRFYVECLAEYSRSTTKDQVYKFARRICSSLFSLEGSESSVRIDLVTFVLASISRECKVEMDNGAIEFVELADYCANKCRAAGTIFCSTLARNLNNMAGDFHQATTPVDLILRLYATGLEFTDDFTTSKGAEDNSAIEVLFIERDKLHNLSALLGSLRHYFNIGEKETCISSDIEYKNSVNQMHLQPGSKGQCSMTCKDRKACIVMYYNTQKFLCQPLAELVNSEKKRILAEIEALTDSSKLYTIQDAFYQFCDSFFSLKRCTSESEREEFDDDEVLVASVIAAGFILSIGTKLKMQKSVCLIKQIIGSGWIQSQGLKYLFVSLHNIGVLMYRSKQMKEALKALKLSYRASWTNIQRLCEMFTHKKGFDDNLSEDAIRGLITDACTRSAFLLEVLHVCGNLKVKRIIVESLENWSLAENLFRQLPGPIPLIKQWVKIQCKLHKNVDVEDSAPTLCCMLLSSTKVSKRTIGIILEQELLAYQELNHGYPDFCQRMQNKVIDLLMQDVYATENSPLWKARILIRKGRALRINGIEALKNCILCLSEAISIMKNFYGETPILGTTACHQLAAAYCLRALCTQEAEPNSEQVYQDICAALDMWLSIFVPDSCSMDDEFKMVSGNTLPLLYNILDLLSVKGWTKLHSNIHQLIIRLYKQNNMQIGKCLANLWECRRLSHALCVSPVNEAFIATLSEHCGETSKSIDFWIGCLSGSQPGLLGFQQNLICFFNTFTHRFKTHERDFKSAVPVNNVKQIVSELISSDPVRSHSLFLAGYLYYDLCERCVSSGQLFEGLSYAKEAFQLRSQLFKRKFAFSIEEQVEKCNETGDIGEIALKVINGPKDLQVQRTVASELWSFDSSSWDLCGCYLSPWNVLQCYLESILQVGYINEMTGNGVEAETFLVWGKSISCSQSLPLFEATFSSVLGKCLEYHGQTHELHKVVWQSISVLVSRKRITQTCSSAHDTFLLDLIGREILGDVFAVERAAILYSIGWITVKNIHSKDTRAVCCDLSNVQLSKTVHWLKLAFVLCREVPVLFQKVSRLLSAIYLLSATTELFSLPSCKALSESHWASYFHQASLGTHLNYQFFPNTCGRPNAQCFVDSRDSHAIGSSCLHTETSTLLRLAPESVKDLEQFVMDFYACLPCTAIICISLLGHAYTSLLQELLLNPSCIHAWMLLSRLNSNNQPVVLLLPLDSVLEEVSDDAAPDDDNARACQNLRQHMNSGKKWHCPWGSTVVDDVAPAFKGILEENFITTSNFLIEDTKSTRSLWWMIRKKVDQQLGKLLSNLEDSWLGPWRHVLLGDCLDCKSLNMVHKKLVRDLKSKCKMDINESFLKLVLGGAKYDIEEACFSWQCLKEGCYIGRLEHPGEEICRSNGIDKVSALASQLIHEAVNELHLADTISREPIILVLDYDVQMLPWESIPILRQQEVYRMPSVGSISLTLERSWHYQEQVGRNAAVFPLIDPLDAFYLLNPSGDLSSTQAEFENWFRDQNFEGKAGTVPTAEELATALKSHDLFLYFGHGSGEQYLSRKEIQELDKCAATLLMGCSSGSLVLNGCYMPRGISLSYLRAGSPVTIANLWEVTDKDIDRFGKAVLSAWLSERLEPADCSQCDQLVKEFEAMKIRGRSKGTSRKKVASSNIDETSNGDSLKNTCDHRPKIGSFVGRARETCTLPFLNGASPVCYGVPTGIRRKKDLSPNS